MFSGRPSVLLSVRASVRDSRGSFMFPWYLQYLLMDFRQTFVTGASRYHILSFWRREERCRKPASISAPCVTGLRSVLLGMSHWAVAFQRISRVSIVSEVSGRCDTVAVDAPQASVLVGDLMICQSCRTYGLLNYVLSDFRQWSWSGTEFDIVIPGPGLREAVGSHCHDRTWQDLVKNGDVPKPCRTGEDCCSKICPRLIQLLTFIFWTF